MGGGICYNREELTTIANRGISASLIGQILIEEAVIGWEELELEVVRDADNRMITVCFIENIDPMGFIGRFLLRGTHADDLGGAPKKLQDYSYRIVGAIQVIGGTTSSSPTIPMMDGCGHRDQSEDVTFLCACIKGHRVSIAFISAKLPAGTPSKTFLLPEGTLDKYTPSGDYVVIKFARWAFEKFREAETGWEPK